ncbi:MAG: type pilus secretin PilQ [Deltaproteobacteria bacterium]|nr:type pilus secretin PilQ [Deltaproteobacteria bacterium]
MFGTNRARLGSIVAVAGTFLGLWALTTISPIAFAKSLSRLAVERNGDTRVIALDGMAQAPYEASRAERPRRIVVDLAGVAIGAAESQKTVFDGLVEEVSLAEFQAASGKTATRLEVTLAADADFDVTRDGERLLLNVRPAATRTSKASAGEDRSAWGEPAAVSAGPVQSASPSAAAPSAPTKVATKLIAVEPQGSPDGTVVRLRTDGTVAGVESSVMVGSPARLVLDLSGVSSSTAPAVTKIDSQQVQRIRVGAHEKKVRVVLDAPDARAFDQRRIMPVADGIVVALGGGAMVEQAIAAAQGEAPAPVASAAAAAQPEAARAPQSSVAAKPAAPAKASEPVKTEPAAVASTDEPAAAATKAVAAAKQSASPAKLATQPPGATDPSVDTIAVLEEGGLLDGKEYAGRRISLDFKDVDIRDVLRLIADVSDLNIIAGDEVAGNVTIRLVDVPWDQALDVILLTKGLGFVRVGNVLRIAPGDTLKSEDEARLQERRAKEKLEDLVVKLQPVNYANVKEVQKLVKRLLTPRGTVDVDERTNTVIIKDIASVIDEATALTKAIDTQTPQVMIEARVVEASLDFSQEIGLEWGAGSQPKVISSPRVVTLDNREAMIEQGVSIPFQTFENGDAQLEFIDAVLSLKVTPHITADRSIIMAIEVTRNAPDNSVETPTGSPAIAKNQAKTETLVKDGQTLVLGGIYVIETAENESRVPFLWKVPVLGNAFKNHGVRDRRKELLIFVQPSVVVSPQSGA